MFVLGAITILEDVIVGFVSTASIKLKVPEPFVDNTWPFEPVLFGKISVYEAPAEWGGALIFTPWVLTWQLS